MIAAQSIGEPGTLLTMPAFTPVVWPATLAQLNGCGALSDLAGLSDASGRPYDVQMTGRWTIEEVRLLARVAYYPVPRAELAVSLL